MFLVIGPLLVGVGAIAALTSVISDRIIAIAENEYVTLATVAAANQFVEWQTSAMARLAEAYAQPATLDAITARDNQRVSHALAEMSPQLEVKHGFISTCLHDAEGRLITTSKTCTACPAFEPVPSAPTPRFLMAAGQPVMCVAIPLMRGGKDVGVASGCIPFQEYVVGLLAVITPVGPTSPLVVLAKLQPNDSYTKLAWPGLSIPGGYSLYLRASNRNLREYVATSTDILLLTAVILTGLTAALVLTLLYRRLSSLAFATQTLPYLAAGQTALLRTTLAKKKREKLLDEVDVLYYELDRVSRMLDETRKAEGAALAEASKAEALEEASRERAKLLEHLVRASEKDKLSLAQDLHDETGQRLVALRLDLAMLDSCTATDVMARIKSNMAELQKTVSGMLQTLRPPMLDTHGLAGSVRQMAAGWQNRAQAIAINVKDISPAIDHIPDILQVTAYRIIQEALTNCIKHANADVIEISLTLQEPGEPATAPHLLLCVNDDGKGISRSPSNKVYGTGLLGIRARVAALNGTFQISSAPNTGTSLTVSLPIVEPQA